MQNFILVVTFVLGAIVMLTGLFVFFKGRKAGAGTLKFLGIEISGSGGPLVLLVGLVLVFAGFNWAASQKQKQQAQTEKNVCVQESKQVAEAASQLHTQLQNEIKLRRELLTQIPASTRRQIEIQRPDLTAIPNLQLSPLVRERIAVEPPARP